MPTTRHRRHVQPTLRPPLQGCYREVLRHRESTAASPAARHDILEHLRAARLRPSEECRHLLQCIHEDAAYLDRRHLPPKLPPWTQGHPRTGLEERDQALPPCAATPNGRLADPA